MQGRRRTTKLHVESRLWDTGKSKGVHLYMQSSKGRLQSNQELFYMLSFFEAPSFHACTYKLAQCGCCVVCKQLKVSPHALSLGVKIGNPANRKFICFVVWMHFVRVPFQSTRTVCNEESSRQRKTKSERTMKANEAFQGSIQKGEKEERLHTGDFQLRWKESGT